MSYLNRGQGALSHAAAQGTDTDVDIGPDSGMPVGDELKLLREENATLRAKAEELEQLFALASKEAEDNWAACQREFDNIIEEKTEVIRTLHQKNAELRERAAAAPAANSPTGGPAVPNLEELLKLQQDLEEQKRQTKEDEESMMGQMRQMEMALAKDRAELARQRAELTRLHDELKHELEVAARDNGLRERLGSLQRRVHSANTPQTAGRQETPQSSGQLPKPPLLVTPLPNKTGLFRRIFGTAQ